MKKLFALLLITPMLFTACDDKEEPTPPPPYFNPVEGEWVYINRYGGITTRIFTKDFNASFTFERNGQIKEENFGKYSINEVYLQYEETGNRHHYKIDKDTLVLFDTNDGWNMSYIRK